MCEQSNLCLFEVLPVFCHGGIHTKRECRGPCLELYSPERTKLLICKLAAFSNDSYNLRTPCEGLGIERSCLLRISENYGSSVSEVSCVCSLNLTFAVCGENYFTECFHNIIEVSVVSSLLPLNNCLLPKEA